MKEFFIRLALYLLRWQLSFIVMYPVMLVIPIDSYALKLVIANLVGGLVFFNFDRLILGKKTKK